MMTLHLRIGLLLVGLAARAGGCTFSADCLHGGTCADNACQCTARFEGATCATEVQADYWQARCSNDKAIKSYRVEDNTNKKHIFGFSCVRSVVDEPGRQSIYWSAYSSVSLGDSPVHFTVVKTDGIDDYLVLCPSEGYFIQIEDQTGESMVNTDLPQGHCAAARIGGSYNSDSLFNAGTRLDQINLPGSFGYLSLVQYATVSVPSHTCAPPPDPSPAAAGCCRYLQQGIRFEYMCTKDLHMIGQEMVLHQNAAPILINRSKVSLRFTTVKDEDYERCEVLEAWAVLYETRPEVIVTAARHAVPHTEACADSPTVFECFPQSCKSDPCSHGGTCVEDQPCICQPEWKGYYCEINRCDPNPCLNGGTCNLGNCTCASGWGGESCESQFCSSNPCLNGGTCTDDKCVCATGYIGVLCEINPCDPNLCKNGATCTDGKCVCATGYTGVHCEVDFCDSNPCQNSGTCTADKCECKQGFGGDFCQTPLCSSPCRYGGTCTVVNGIAECSCQKNANIYLITKIEYYNIPWQIDDAFFTRFMYRNPLGKEVSYDIIITENDATSTYKRGRVSDYLYTINIPLSVPLESIDGLIRDDTEMESLTKNGINTVDTMNKWTTFYGQLQVTTKAASGAGKTPNEPFCSSPFTWLGGDISCPFLSIVGGYTNIYAGTTLEIYIECNDALPQELQYQTIEFTTGEMKNAHIESFTDYHIVEKKYIVLCPKRHDHTIHYAAVTPLQPGACVALRMAYNFPPGIYDQTSVGPLNGNGLFTIVQYSASPWRNRCKGAVTTQDSCQNGGVCKAETGPHPFGHRCECPATHTGDNCETAK